MKKIYTLMFAMLGVVTSIHAQAPEAFNYQTVIRNSSGAVIADQNVTIRINIFGSAQSTAAVYSEIHRTKTNSFGLVNLQIGRGSTPTSSFDKIEWGTDNYYVQTEIDVQGGTNFSTMGTSQLLSVPYALYAKSAGVSAGSTGRGVEWTRTGSNLHPTNLGDQVGIGTSTPTSLLHVSKFQTEPTITIENTGSNGGATFRMFDQLSGADFKFKSTFFGDFKIRDQTNALDVMLIRGDGTGNIGLGTESPGARLHVQGDLRIQDGTAHLSVSNLGTSGEDGVKLEFAKGGSSIEKGLLSWECLAGSPPSLTLWSQHGSDPGGSGGGGRVAITEYNLPGETGTRLELISETGGLLQARDTSGNDLSALHLSSQDLRLRPIPAGDPLVISNIGSLGEDGVRMTAPDLIEHIAQDQFNSTPNPDVTLHLDPRADQIRLRAADISVDGALDLVGGTLVLDGSGLMHVYDKSTPILHQALCMSGSRELPPRLTLSNLGSAGDEGMRLGLADSNDITTEIVSLELRSVAPISVLPGVGMTTLHGKLFVGNLGSAASSGVSLYDASAGGTGAHINFSPNSICLNPVDTGPGCDYFSVMQLSVSGFPGTCGGVRLTRGQNLSGLEPRLDLRGDGVLDLGVGISQGLRLRDASTPSRDLTVLEDNSGISIQYRDEFSNPEIGKALEVVLDTAIEAPRLHISLSENYVPGDGISLSCYSDGSSVVVPTEQLSLSMVPSIPEMRFNLGKGYLKHGWFGSASEGDGLRLSLHDTNFVPIELVSLDLVSTSPIHVGPSLRLNSEFGALHVGNHGSASSSGVSLLDGSPGGTRGHINFTPGSVCINPLDTAAGPGSEYLSILADPTTPGAGSTIRLTLSQNLSGLEPKLDFQGGGSLHLRTSDTASIFFSAGPSPRLRLVDDSDLQVARLAMSTELGSGIFFDRTLISPVERSLSLVPDLVNDGTPLVVTNLGSTRQEGVRLAVEPQVPIEIVALSLSSVGPSMLWEVGQSSVGVGNLGTLGDDGVDLRLGSHVRLSAVDSGASVLSGGGLYIHPRLNDDIFLKVHSDSASSGTLSLGSSSTLHTYEYDALERRVRWGGASLYVYDEADLRTEYAYDAVDRRIECVRSDVTPGSTTPSHVYEYDALNNRIRETGPAERSYDCSDMRSTETYDPISRRIECVRSDVTPGSTAVPDVYLYDAVNSRVRLSGPDKRELECGDMIKSYEWDLGARTLTETMQDNLTPSAQPHVRVFDAANNELRSSGPPLRLYVSSAISHTSAFDPGLRIVTERYKDEDNPTPPLLTEYDLNAQQIRFLAPQVHVQGQFTATTKLFTIDHPKDPYNKVLRHVSVESPEMLNIYNGNISTDEKGYATVDLPDYFDALNMDFRYQLTVVGEFAQAIVKEKVNDNRFVIMTDKPNVEVSWQITGVRQDTYARENKIVVEEEKTEAMKGELIYEPRSSTGELNKQ